jgi:hypothetical protein
VFPFENASDTRIFMADEIIVEQTAELVVAFQRAAMQQKMSADVERGYVLKLVDHLLNKEMADELMDQVELSAQYILTYGWTVLHARWSKEVALERKTVELAKLKEIVGQYAVEQSIAQSAEEAQAVATQAVMDFEAMLMDERRDKETAQVLAGLHAIYAAEVLAGEGLELPELSAASLKRAVKALRAEGKAELPVPYVCRDEPEIVALMPYGEVFIHSDVANIRKARVFHRVFMTEVELKEKQLTEGWKKEWVEQALQHKGYVSVWSDVGREASVATPNRTIEGSSAFATHTMRDHKNGLVEVIYATYWASDEDGVPGVYVTVFHANEKTSAAVHALAKEGKISYVAGRREKNAPQIAASRGVPEIVIGYQREKKAMRDSAVDLASLAVMPPLNKYSTALGANYKFGPGVVNTVQLGREPKFMEIPKNGAPLAERQQENIDRDVRWYFARMHEEVPMPLAQIRSQYRANSFLGTWAKAISMAVDLWRHNGTDAEFSKITGAPEGWFTKNRERRDLWGGGAELAFDMRELDPEFVMKRNEVMNSTVLPGDVSGAIDRRAWTLVQLMGIDPMLGRRLIKDQAAASQQLFDEVRNEIAQMFLGNPPKMVELDPTAQTKLQYAMEIVQKNPQYAEGLKAGGRFSKMMVAFTKNLEHSIQQEQNKKNGRIGVNLEEVEAAG